jgi:hypothetical protein
MTKKEDVISIEEAVARNDEEWQKRLLLLIITMIISFLSLDL